MSQGPVNTKCSVVGVTTNKNTPNKNLNDAYDEKDANGLTPCENIDRSGVCVLKGANDYNNKMKEVKTAGTAVISMLNKIGVNPKYLDGLDPVSRGQIYGPMTLLANPLQTINKTGPLFGATGSPTVSREQSERMQRGAEHFRSASETSGRANFIAQHKKVLDGIAGFKRSKHYKDSADRAQFDTQFAALEKAIKEADKILNGPELGGQPGKSDSSCIENLYQNVAKLQSAGKSDFFPNVRAGYSNHGDMKKAVKDAEEDFAKVQSGAMVVEFTYDLQYKEQCILLSQIAPLADYSYALDNSDVSKDGTTADGEKEKTRRRLPYESSVGSKANAPLIVDGESFGFMNKLTQYPGMRKFYEIEPAQLSSLQPMIRLYRVASADSTDRDAYETEIAFDSYFNDTGYTNEKGEIESLLKLKSKRGHGVGIKSLNVTFDGQDMFAQKRCIKANLSIFANDFDELLMERDFGDGKFRYIDLALKTGKKIKSDKLRKYKTNDDLNFRLKAVFGWQKPNGAGPATGLKDALQNTYVSVNLTPVTHTFDFDDFGRVTFNIEYLAYIEEFYAKPTMDIFTDSETYSTILRRKLAFESANRTISNSSAGCKDAEALRNQIKEIKAADQETIKQEKKAMLARLINQLFIGNYIHYLNLSREDLESAIKLGPYHNVVQGKVTKGDKEMQKNLSSDVMEAFSSGIMEGTDDLNKRKEMAGALMVAGGDAVNIPFFYIGDLLNVIMGSMTDFLTDVKSKLVAAPAYQQIPIAPEILQAETVALTKAVKEYERFRLILGPLEIVNHADESVKYVNFADVPISVKYFTEWLTSKLLKKDQSTYPLTQFLKDLFNDLLRNFLNDDTCYPFSIKQKTRLFEGAVTSYPPGGGQKGKPTVDEITHLLKGKFRNKYNRLNLLGKKAQDWSVNEARPILNIRGKSPYSRPNPGMAAEMNYFIFYAGRTQPMNLMNGQKSEDEKRGIFHYMIGREKGLLKTITLNKTDTPGLKEVRFEQEGYDGLHQLREIYDVEIDSYANLSVFPGNYIFVDPQGFAPSTAAFDKTKFDLTDIGVGGYYMVTKASHDLAPGVANSKLTAVWVAAAMSAKDNAIIESARGGNEMKSAKCHSAQSAAGKVGTNNVAGFYEGSSATTTDFSRLDDNPNDPEGAKAKAEAAAREAKNDAIGDAYAGM